MAISTFIPALWSARLLAHLDKNLVLGNLVNRDYEGEIKNLGDRVKINQIADVTIKDYKKGTDLVYDDTDGTPTELVIDQQKYFALKVNDVDAAQANIDLDALVPCSSTQVVTGRAGDMVLYNYRELLMIYGLKPLEFLQVFRLHGWVQVDKTHRGVFVKIFCPQGQQDPRSSRTDWGKCQHAGPGELHPVDRKNSWAFTLEDYQITGRVLHVTGTLWKSPLWQDEILYFNHGGQAIPLQEGENSFNLLYVPGEDVYMGTKYSRYPGRCIKLTEGRN